MVLSKGLSRLSSCVGQGDSTTRWRRFPRVSSEQGRSSVLAPDSIEELMAGSLARVYGTTHQGTLLRKKRSRLFPLPFGTIPRKTGAPGESASRLESRRFGFSLGPWLRKEQTQLEACQVVQPRHPDQGSGTIPRRYLQVPSRIESPRSSAGRNQARLHSGDRYGETVHPIGEGYLSASRLGFLLRVGDPRRISTLGGRSGPPTLAMEPRAPRAQPRPVLQSRVANAMLPGPQGKSCPSLWRPRALRAGFRSSSPTRTP